MTIVHLSTKRFKTGDSALIFVERVALSAAAAFISFGGGFAMTLVLFLPLSLVGWLIEAIFPASKDIFDSWSMAILYAIGYLGSYAWANLMLYKAQDLSFSSKGWRQLRKRLDDGVSDRSEKDSHESMVP